MDLKVTEARNDCAGVGQQQFNRPTDQNCEVTPLVPSLVVILKRPGAKTN
jgi:hypothetical protein